MAAAAGDEQAAVLDAAPDCSSAQAKNFTRPLDGDEWWQCGNGIGSVNGHDADPMVDDRAETAETVSTTSRLRSAGNTKVGFERLSDYLGLAVNLPRTGCLMTDTRVAILDEARLTFSVLGHAIVARTFHHVSTDPDCRKVI